MAKKIESKQKKMDARVDFTPMVDMIMLLVTFFMLCTTLLKPQTMEISMPSDKDDIKDEQRNQAKASEAVTILIAGENRVFYFEGKPEEAEKTMVEAEYGGGNKSLRAFLLKKNAVAQTKVAALKKEYETKEINEDTKKEYNKRLSEIKSEKGTPTVIIKAADNSTYDNLIKVLDEMQICAIGKYVIDNFSDVDKALLVGKGVKFPNK